MALSQIQIIRSLADALSWFEKEVQWGVAPAELRHLSGRIGELYAAMITRGQMALAVNQRGYDVVGAEGDRISVKTITTATHVAFNPETLDQVDRIIILRILVDEGDVSIEELLDKRMPDALADFTDQSGRPTFYPGRTRSRDLTDLAVIAQGTYDDLVIGQLENGTITIDRDGIPQTPVLPILRRIAEDIGVQMLNTNGNPKNTRTLGADVLTALNMRLGSATSGRP